MLLDGHGQSKADSPQESAFFGDAGKGKILLDLGSAVRVRKINTYSWHSSVMVDAGSPSLHARAPQQYTLYGSVGDSPPPIPGDPVVNGWTLISRVNTDDFFSVPPMRNRPEQQAVSIMGTAGAIGRFRFLLWEIRPRSVRRLTCEAIQNTFYGEFNVYAE